MLPQHSTASPPFFSICVCTVCKYIVESFIQLIGSIGGNNAQSGSLYQRDGRIIVYLSSRLIAAALVEIVELERAKFLVVANEISTISMAPPPRRQCQVSLEELFAHFLVFSPIVSTAHLRIVLIGGYSLAKGRWSSCSLF